jgi:serine/threonine protein kinase
LIQREVSILKTLKHPLILELRQHISDTPDHNSVIVTEFAGNGSLANHLSPMKYRLSGANRITKVVIGICLAMRYLHSQNVIHRDLKPDNISPENPEIPSHIDPNSPRNWASVDYHYLAPECYENHYYPESDVFSFSLILYELLVGQPAFPKHLTVYQIALKVVIKDERPDIPKFVLPNARELIEDCWATNPSYRPSFEEIVERLVKMKFKLMPNVNSRKISEFVNKIGKLEAQN